MRIPIKENVELFGSEASTFHSFLFMQLWLEALTRDFHARFPNVSIDSPRQVEAEIIQNIIRGFASFYRLATDGIDYNTCAVVARSLVDRVALLIFIYGTEDEDELHYRHFLYVLDGLLVNQSLLNDEAEYNGSIPLSVYNQLHNQILNARHDVAEAISFCKEKLSNHPYSEQFSRFHNLAVKKAAWRYKEVGKLGRKDISQYKWEDLYELLDERKSITSFYSHYLSQFVHGISISNLLRHSQFDNFESLLSIGVCLQGLVLNELRRAFNDNNLFKNVTYDDMIMFLSLYSPEKRQSFLDGLKQFFDNTVRPQT